MYVCIYVCVCVCGVCVCVCVCCVCVCVCIKVDREFLKKYLWTINIFISFCYIIKKLNSFQTSVHVTTA